MFCNICYAPVEGKKDLEGNIVCEFCGSLLIRKESLNDS